MVNNNGDERNDIDYLWLMEYLESNRGLAYSNPDKAAPTDADKFKKIRDKGRKASEIMEKMAKLCESHFDLEFCDRYVSWLDGSNTKIRKYLWAQLKYDEYKKDPVSISLFVDMSERTNHARFRFSLEIKDDSSDKVEMAKYHKHLELPLPSESSLVYVCGSNEFSDPIVLDEDQQVIKSKVEAGEYDKVQICKVIEWNEQLTNAEIEKEMLAGIDELIPYYNYVIGYNSRDLSAQVEEGDKEVAKVEFDKNMILFGPPGTGKTYNTAIYAVAICDKLSLDEVKARPYEEVLDRYRVLKSEEKRVAFTIFHQSFGYEEFIEGIKPKMDSDSTDIEYTVKDGVFKEFCKRASKKTVETTEFKMAEEASIWKVTIRNEVKQDCFDNDRIRINWDIDSEGAKGLKNEMMIGDIILTTDGNRKRINGIAVVTGDEAYEVNDTNDRTTRNVKWLAKNMDSDITGINAGKILSRKTVAGVPNMSISDAVDLAKRENKELAETVITKNNEPYVFIIDEINRGNISKIFGELITLIEPSKRKCEKEAMEVTLPYSNVPFGVPNNVYLIGTMNTADRSIDIMDTALRRRFQFEEMMPDPQVLRNIGADKVVEGNIELDVAEMLEVINKRIEYLFDREHTIGHAFFTELKYEPTVQKLASIFKKSVIPLLQEYFYEDYSKIRMVLGDNGKENAEHMFILANEIKSNQIFRGDTSDIDIPDYSYVIQDKAFDNIISYKEII